MRAAGFSDARLDCADMFEAGYAVVDMLSLRIFVSKVEMPCVASALVMARMRYFPGSSLADRITHCWHLELSGSRE